MRFTIILIGSVVCASLVWIVMASRYIKDGPKTPCAVRYYSPVTHTWVTIDAQACRMVDGALWVWPAGEGDTEPIHILWTPTIIERGAATQ